MYLVQTIGKFHHILLTPLPIKCVACLIARLGGRPVEVGGSARGPTLPHVLVVASQSRLVVA